MQMPAMRGNRAGQFGFPNPLRLSVRRRSRACVQFVLGSLENVVSLSHRVAMVLR